MKTNFLLLALVLVSLLNAQTPVEKHGQLHVDSIHIVNEHNQIVQLRGMSLFWSQWGPKFYNYEALKWLRDDWKITVIRAAMGTGADQDGYLADSAAERTKVDTVIEAALKLGLYVIVDWHSHDAHNHEEEAKAFFEDIAKKYGHYPNLMYEIYNEPERISWSDIIKPYNEAVIEVIRKHDPDNIIMCGSSVWSQAVHLATEDPLEGDNLVYSLHYYAAVHKQQLRNDAQVAIDRGKALFVNEFGTVNNSALGPVDVESTNKWFELLDKYKIGWCNWAINDKDETASALIPDVSAHGGWTRNEMTESGRFIYDKLWLEYYRENIDENSVPMVFNSPDSCSVNEGGELQLSVLAISPDTLEYQWYFNNKAIDQAVNSVLIVDTFGLENVGNYYVEVINSNGYIHSDTVEIGIVTREPYNGIIEIPGIIEAENFDIGGNGFTYYDMDSENQGGYYRMGEDVDIGESEEEGGYQVENISTGEWLEYSVNVANDGEYLIVVWVASMNGSGLLRMEFGNYASQIFSIPQTNSLTSRKFVYAVLDLKAGEQIVRLTLANGGVNRTYNLDKIDVSIFTGEYPVSSTSIEEAGNIIYPNPTKGVVQIELENQSQVELYYGSNRIDVFSAESTLSYSLHEYPSGLYIFKIVDSGGVKIKKVIKE